MSNFSLKKKKTEICMPYDKIFHASYHGYIG